MVDTQSERTEKTMNKHIVFAMGIVAMAIGCGAADGSATSVGPGEIAPQNAERTAVKRDTQSSEMSRTTVTKETFAIEQTTPEALEERALQSLPAEPSSAGVHPYFRVTCQHLPGPVSCCTNGTNTCCCSANGCICG
jgi:hypothetical protein